jgi:protein-arginine deiminase
VNDLFWQLQVIVSTGFVAFFSAPRGERFAPRGVDQTRHLHFHRVDRARRDNTRMKTPRLIPVVTSLAALVSCGGEAPPTMSMPDAAVDRPAPPPPLPAVRLLVDSNRNGRLDDTHEEWSQRAVFTRSHGASLMANVDDDDDNNRIDALDEAVNGDADALDLAHLRVPAWRAAPMDAEGVLSVDEEAATKVTLFRQTADGWIRFNPAESRLSADDLRAGVEFGIEARDFPGPQWNGHVTLTLTVTAEGREYTDQAAMRTAPWLMYNSLDPTVRIWGPQAQGYGPAMVFTQDLEDHSAKDMMPITLVNTLDPAYRMSSDEGPDVWIQDIMEFGWTGIPGPDGFHAMPVVMRTPLATRAVARYVERELLGPDFGFVWKRASQTINGRSWDPSLDSFGDLELLPPHRVGDRDFSLGRIIHGSVATRSSDTALRGFLDAQGVQGPVLYVDTSWLAVGHIDEVISFVPADTPRGWKLLIASPRLARTMLTDFVRRDPAHGSALLFEGKRWYYTSGPMMGRPYAAQRTVQAVLDDMNLMTFNQQTQARIEMLREQLQEEVGLADEDILEIPFLFWPQEQRRAGAYMPGTVNLLYYNRVAIVARPYGPLSQERDIVEDDMTERLGTLGVTVRFAEQWDILHTAQGEVHCGTNALREIPARRWWEVPR